MSTVAEKKAKIKAAIDTISSSLQEISDILLEGDVVAEKSPPQKRKKDPNAPKQPPSSYIMYVNTIKEQVEKENPDATFADKSKIYGAKWQKLSDEEKKAFADKSKVEKEKYVKELAAYNENHGITAEPPAKKAKKEKAETKKAEPKKAEPKKAEPKKAVAEPKKAKKQAAAEPEKKASKKETPVEPESSEAESSDSESDSGSDSSESSSSSSDSSSSNDSGASGSESDD